MKAWPALALLASVGCVLATGCGGVTETDEAGGSGGSDEASGGSGGTAAQTGGNDAGGTDSGGSGSGGALASGGTSGTEGCPTAPVARLFPVIGPFWFGPDPGPCSSGPEGSTYTYGDELLMSSTTGGGETYLRDDQDRLIEVVSATDPATYEYTGGTVTENRSTHAAVYTLSSNGYPLRADVLTVGSSEPVTYTYEYDECRLSLRDAPGDAADRSYGYDEAGHLTAITDGASVTTFVYDCW